MIALAQHWRDDLGHEVPVFAVNAEDAGDYVIRLWRHDSRVDLEAAPSNLEQVTVPPRSRV